MRGWGHLSTLKRDGRGQYSSNMERLFTAPICSCAVVEALDLKEGDEIEISIAGKRDFKVARNRPIERAFEQLRQMKWSFPPDFKFDREEINER
jgi:antitoxin MazE